jgi:hypothetical protein
VKTHPKKQKLKIQNKNICQILEVKNQIWKMPHSKNTKA